MEINIIKLMYVELTERKKKNEALLEILINSPLTSTLHLECLKVIEEISKIKTMTETLDNYLSVEEK